ncbi:MAG: hypothetical protein ACXADD_09190 [Candidatus Thorarchaeota archaeon]|jgi:hypothetical protein
MTSHEEGRGQSLDDIFGDFAELELENVTIQVDEPSYPLNSKLHLVSTPVLFGRSL